MNESFNELLEICEKEYKLMLKIIESLKQEKEHLVKLDTKKLEEGNIIKENLIFQFKILENSRLEITHILAQALNITQDPVSLRTLADHEEIPDQTREKLHIMREKLRRTAVESSAAADINRKLLFASTVNAKKLTDLIVQQVNGKSCTYAPPNQKKNANAYQSRPVRSV